MRWKSRLVLPVILICLGHSPSVNACSCAFEPAGFVGDSGGLLPANNQGVLWEGRLDPTDEGVISILDPTEGDVPVEVEPASPSRGDLWLIRPKGGFKAGHHYELTSRPGPRRTSTLTVQVSDEDLASSAVGLEIGKSVALSRNVPQAASCSRVIEAAQIAVNMVVPEAVAPFLGFLTFETHLDGVNEWYAAESLCSRQIPGRSSAGIAKEQIYRNCEVADGYLSGGPHLVRMTARLPGTDVVLTTDDVQFEIPCSKDAVRAEGYDASMVQPPTVVDIPAGRFTMGHGGDDPQLVVVEEPFKLMAFEVTFDEYALFARLTNRSLPSRKPGWYQNARDWGGTHPVVNVTWFEAADYARWLSASTGQRYRLPTSAQWEYAARAGADTIYHWGDDVGVNNASCRECGDEESDLMPVGSYPPNLFGLYDMHGNAAEFVSDCYRGVMRPGKVQVDCDTAVTRGGSYNDGPEWSHLHMTHFAHKTERGPMVGFRLLRED